MSDDIKKPDGEQDQKPAETTEEKTMGDIIDETVPPADPVDPTPEDKETVPLASFMEMKKDAKKFEKLYNDLKIKSAKGETSPEDIADELQSLAEEFDIEPKFVNKLAKILEGKAEKKAGEVLKPILERDATLTAAEKKRKLDEAFTKHYTEALEKMPEYTDIANADAIKALSFLPENAKKTFSQLIEETYGKAITGKRTIETTKPGGGKDPEPIDYDRAKNDTEYFKTIMADPAKKKEYNTNMLAPRGRRS